MAKITMYHLPERYRNVKHVTVLIDTLRELCNLAKKDQVPRPMQGICMNWSAILSSHELPGSLPFDIVEQLGEDWPSTAGSYVIVNRHGEGVGFANDDPIGDYRLPNPIVPWEGHWLSRRMDLMTYMLGRLRSFRQQLQNQEKDHV